MGIVLTQEAAQRLGDEATPIVGGHDTAHQWLMHSWRQHDWWHPGCTPHMALYTLHCSGRGQRLVDFDQRGWSKVGTGIAAAMHSVVLFFTAQPCAAKLVLIAPLARFKAAFLFNAAPLSERCTMYIGRTGPCAMPAGARRTDVVVHLPAWTKAVCFIRRTNGFDDLAPDDIAEICQAVERLQRTHLAPEPQYSFLCCPRDLIGRAATVWVDALLVPGKIGGRPSQAVTRIGLERCQQVL